MIRRWVQGVGSIKAQKCLYLKFSWCTLRLCYRVPKVVGIKQGGDGGAYQGPNIKDVCKCKKCKHYYTFPHSSTLRPSRSLEPVHGSISVPVTAAQAKPELSFQFFLHLKFLWILFLTPLLEYNRFTMVCFFLYNKVNQLRIYIYPHIPSLLHLPPTLPIPPL